MSYSGKRSTTAVVTGFTLIVAYVIYALSERAPAPDDLNAWAILMLIFIGIGVVASIAVQIVFHIAYAIGIAMHENDRTDKEIGRIMVSTTREDERDKTINYKSSFIGYIFVGTGMIAMLVVLAAGASAVISIHVLAGGFALGSLAEGIASVYYYERNV